MPWSGVVRLECSADLPLPEVTRLGDLTARLLPPLASVPHKDPRAPQNLVPIGRFADLTGLTIKALRLYDQRGVLRPAVVDFKSGFRYYSLDQVADAQQIRLLRSLEMPLDEIRVLLNAPDPVAMRGCLVHHQQRIEERIVG